MFSVAVYQSTETNRDSRALNIYYHYFLNSSWGQTCTRESKLMPLHGHIPKIQKNVTTKAKRKYAAFLNQKQTNKQKMYAFNSGHLPRPERDDNTQQLKARYTA